MERHKCKLCSRTFNSGRALGGHMKAHLATLPLPPKPFPQSSPPLSFSSSSSQSQHEEKGFIYELRENPKKSLKIADPEFSLAIDNTTTAAGSVIVQDRESETESKNPTRKRSKRNRNSSLNKKQRFMLSTPPQPPSTVEPEPVSSVSDTSPEEDVAMCLMMLSRDKWRRRNKDEEEESKGCNVEIKIKAKRVRGKHVCVNCSKAFRTSKALGSHRSVCYDDGEGKEGNVNNDSKVFECPFCLKVFGSGQALGGHKRSHLIASSSNSISPANANVNADAKTSCVSRILKESFIDLNLPAQPEDDDLSVLSDA